MTVESSVSNLSGIDLLEETMNDVGEFITKSESDIHIAFDEFQEITELKDPRIEGVLRKHIQEYQELFYELSLN